MFLIPENNWDFLTEERLLELQKIHEKIQEKSYFPEDEKVLRFLKMDIHSIRYIIVGMEPYPTAIKNAEGREVPEATGRSFEVESLRGKTWASKFKQSSLRNILKTIYFNETGEQKPLDFIRGEIGKSFFISDPCDWFDKMEQQGVLFLNASLTVQPYKVGTHTRQWEAFMTELIRFLNEKTEAEWMIWGSDARKRVEAIVPKERCIFSWHPRLSQFIDANCFQYAKKVNWCV